MAGPLVQAEARVASCDASSMAPLPHFFGFPLSPLSPSRVGNVSPFRFPDVPLDVPLLEQPRCSGRFKRAKRPYSPPEEQRSNAKDQRALASRDARDDERGDSINASDEDEDEVGSGPDGTPSEGNDEMAGRVWRAMYRKPWSQAEDEAVRCAVNAHGTRAWSLVAQLVPGRTGKQCRERVSVTR